MVNLQKVPVDAAISVRGSALKELMDRDRAQGKIPFYVSMQYEPNFSPLIMTRLDKDLVVKLYALV